MTDSNYTTGSKQGLRNPAEKPRQYREIGQLPPYVVARWASLNLSSLGFGGGSDLPTGYCVSVECLSVPCEFPIVQV